MTRKNIILLLILGLLVGAFAIPFGRGAGPAVVHQHESWPGESEQTTGLDVNGTLSTHLPILIIKADGNGVPGFTREDTRELVCDYAIIHNKTGVNRSDDPPSQTGRMAISIRGNSSRYLPKKQYRLGLLDEQNQSESVSLLEMPAENSWVLNGSYIDHSLIRNYMLCNISGEIMGYAPRSRLCEVMFTDADGKLQYQGVYTLMEKVKVSEDRLDLTQYDPSYRETSFLVQINSQKGDISFSHLKPDNLFINLFNLEYPNPQEVSDTSLEYIENELLVFEKKLYDALHVKNWNKVEELIDMNSFAEYFIINEFFQNYDAGTLSTYLYKNLGGKIMIGPVWDFDGALNNFKKEVPINSLDISGTFYYGYLIQDPAFIKQVVSTYKELRKNQLSEEYLLNYIERSNAYLKAPARRNCDRWYHGDYSSYLRDIEAMKRYVVQRGTWMDENFERLMTVVG